MVHGHHEAGTVAVLLDGRVIGRVAASRSTALATQLRRLKVQRAQGVPPLLEIACVPVAAAGAFAGLFLFTSPARMMRPAVNLSAEAVEMIGSFEQTYMDIAVVRSEIVAGRTTHVEEAPTHMLSVIANITPFSDFNQSPRNMYQCQVRGRHCPDSFLRRRGGKKKEKGAHGPRRRGGRWACAPSLPVRACADGQAIDGDAHALVPVPHRQQVVPAAVPAVAHCAADALPALRL